MKNLAHSFILLTADSRYSNKYQLNEIIEKFKENELKYRYSILNREIKDKDKKVKSNLKTFNEILDDIAYLMYKNKIVFYFMHSLYNFVIHGINDEGYETKDKLFKILSGKYNSELLFRIKGSIDEKDKRFYTGLYYASKGIDELSGLSSFLNILFHQQEYTDGTIEDSILPTEFSSEEIKEKIDYIYKTYSDFFRLYKESTYYNNINKCNKEYGEMMVILLDKIGTNYGNILDEKPWLYPYNDMLEGYNAGLKDFCFNYTKFINGITEYARLFDNIVESLRLTYFYFNKELNDNESALEDEE